MDTCAHLFLFLDDVGQLRVRDPGVQLTLHQRGSFIVLDVAQIAALRHLDVLGEALGEWIVKTQSISKDSATSPRDSGWYDAYTSLDILGAAWEHHLPLERLRAAGCS